MSRPSSPRYTADYLRAAALREVHRQAARLPQLAAYMVRRAHRYGVRIHLSSELGWTGDGVSLTITFRLQDSDVDMVNTDRSMRSRERVMWKLVDYIEARLLDVGVVCDVDKHVVRREGRQLELIQLEVSFRLRDVVLARAVNAARRCLRIGLESETRTGWLRSAFLNYLDAAAVREVVGGAEAGPPEEAGGVAEEGGGEEGAVGAGAGHPGAGEGAEGGWMRVHEAIMKYGVPLSVLWRKLAEGAVRSYVEPGPGWKPRIYVSAEDVEALAESLRPDKDERRGR